MTAAATVRYPAGLEPVGEQQYLAFYQPRGDTDAYGYIYAREPGETAALIWTAGVFQMTAAQARKMAAALLRAADAIESDAPAPLGQPWGLSTR